MEYVAIDVHKKQSQICCFTEASKLLLTSRGPPILPPAARVQPSSSSAALTLDAGALRGGSTSRPHIACGLEVACMRQGYPPLWEIDASKGLHSMHLQNCVILYASTHSLSLLYSRREASVTRRDNV